MKEESVTQYVNALTEQQAKKALSICIQELISQELLMIRQGEKLDVVSTSDSESLI